MLKRRLVAVLYLREGWIVRSERFQVHQVIGNPMVHVERMVQWDVDELIVLDISPGERTYDFRRDDYREAGAVDLLEFTYRVSAECRIPLAFGGGIRTLDDVRTRIQNGADKVTLNSILAERPELVTEAAHAFGSQAVIASLDYRVDANGVARAFTHHGRNDSGKNVVEWARMAENLGAGEILLNAIDRDGTAQGYDIDSIQQVAEAVNIPVIACGGAGHMRHFAQCFAETDASAVAAGNIFHFTENAYPRIKAYLRERRSDIR